MPAPAPANRPLTAAALFVELAVLALFGIAVLAGDFDQGGAFFGLLAVALAGVAAAAAWTVPDEGTGRLVTHGALLTGCVVFAFPFVWLVSTSFKYNEEIFVYPPRWVPSVPPAVAASPWVTPELLPELPPEECPWPEARWQQAEEALAAALQGPLGERIAALPGAAQIAPADVQRTVLHGLAVYGARRLPADAWEADPPVLAQRLLQGVDDELLRTVWDAVYRGVELRAPTVQTVQRDYLPFPGDAVGAWRVSAGAAQLSVAHGDGPPARRLVYDLREQEEVVLEAELALPVPAERFLGLNLPLRPDRSWHAWRVDVEVGGRRYTTRDALYLDQYRWQEVGFKLAHVDDRDERDLGIWPLVPAEDGAAVDVPPDRLRLRLTIDEASRLSALWRKYTHHYREAQVATQYWWNYVANSVYLVVLSMIGQALSCSLVAYAFARLNWPGREALFALLLATMMLPPQVTMIPVFMIFEKLGWYNTLRALWAPSFLGSAFFIFLLRQFMKSIPNDLEDAAKIDGCSHFGIYWRIILPLVKPALAAVCIFTFMNTWNDFMGPLIYINDQRLYPLALGLFDFRSQHSTEFGMLMAASTLMTLPVIALFFLAQRYFIQGVTLTCMKG
jgi:multiple sugar transport system permease protein